MSIDSLPTSHEGALTALVASIIRMRGGATAFRCGLCGERRTSEDIANREFTHRHDCPAEQVHMLELANNDEDPLLVRVDHAEPGWQNSLDGSKPYMLKVCGELFIGHVSSVNPGSAIFNADGGSQVEVSTGEEPCIWMVS